MFFSIIHYRKTRKIDELMSFLMWIYFITYNFLFFKKVLRQNTYLTAYSVTGGRFPRARLEPPRRKLLRGLESRAVPAGVAAFHSIC